MSIESSPRDWGHTWPSEILFSLILRSFVNTTSIHSVLLLKNLESSSIAGRKYWVADGKVVPVFRSKSKRLIPRFSRCSFVRVLAIHCPALPAIISRSFLSVLDVINPQRLLRLHPCLFARSFSPLTSGGHFGCA